MRVLPALCRAAIEDPYNGDPELGFLTITYPNIGVPLRFVGDVVDYVLGGNTHIGVPFDLTLLSDTDDAPHGRLVVQNADRAIGEAVRPLSNPLQVTIEIYFAHDFDLTVRPRVALGTPQLCYRASNLYFRQISVDAFSCSGQLTSWDYASQPWPSKFATQGLLRGLFRGGEWR